MTAREDLICRIDPALKPILTVVVDTEEEFDWATVPTRETREVGHMRNIRCFQDAGGDFGVRPSYLVTYPIVDRPEGHEELQRLASEGQAVIGAHLHPWSTPPQTETLSWRNSYPGNLPAGLEREKLENLSAKIRSVFGAEPRVYKAGRYGIGPHSHPILEDLGFEVDTSPSPPMNYGADGGPDFSSWPLAPSWTTPAKKLLVLPCTGAFTGALAAQGAGLYAVLRGPLGLRFRLPGVFSRLGLLDRLRLTPEGYGLEELKRVTRYCLDRGVRIFTFNLHSSTIRPGAGDYVHNEEDLRRFLKTIRDYYRFFFEEIGGVFRDPLEIRAMLQAGASGATTAAGQEREHV
jgi:hypothetical protein